MALRHSWGLDQPWTESISDRKLIVNEPEAGTVHYIFRLYRQLRSVRELRERLVAEGVTSKRRVLRHGRVTGGKPINRGALYYLLRNRIYRGQIVHKDKAYPGEHEAIIDRELWELHGSIHWQLRDNELCARHPDLSAFSSYRGLDPEEKAERLTKAAAGLPAVGILPTANKYAQTLTAPFAHLFRALQIRLSAPQTFLLMLGYGFGDDHVTRILESALMNPSLVMLVIEPNPKSATIERMQRYKDLGKRAFVLTATQTVHAGDPFKFATFDDFAHSIMPDVQWLDDFLRLRRFEKQIQASDSPLARDSDTGPVE